eukprot:334952-Alexandrium_andersonii.AAC.1
MRVVERDVSQSLSCRMRAALVSDHLRCATVAFCGMLRVFRLQLQCWHCGPCAGRITHRLAIWAVRQLAEG